MFSVHQTVQKVYLGMVRLKVQGCGSGNFRFVINSEDSTRFFQCRGIKVVLWLSETNKGEINTTLDTPSDDKGM